MEKKLNFIKTRDEETRDKLISCGFALIDSNGGTYTFLNCKAMQFDEAAVDTSKIRYSNMLSI